MATRLLFPADRTAYVYTALGEPILVPAHAALTLYTEQACINLADICTLDGGRIVNSTIYTDDAGLIPEFLGPLALTRLWAKPIDGAAYPIDAQYGPRIDDLAQHLPGGSNTILHGHGAPDPLLGEDGDFYLDVDAVVLWGPRVADAWPSSGISLQGGAGATGPAGPAGPAGSNANASYTFNQYASSDTWNITHTLGFVPNVMVVDSAGTRVEGDVSVLSTSQLQIRFSAPFAGSAFLS